MHAYKHMLSLGIVSDVLSAVNRINSPVFLRGAVSSVHFFCNEVHNEQRVFIVEAYARKKLPESVLESFVVLRIGTRGGLL
jgi:hypothetical protein